jgi:hypothetical protein
VDLTELQNSGRELRIDVGSLRSRGRRTPQGFLKVPGNLTRTGVLTYYRADGSKFRELRHPDEVFNADSLGTLAFAPVTERHPGGLVSPKNVAKVQVGIVTDARRDGRFVAGDLVVQNDQTISRVLGGKLRELSPGYTCRIDHVSGEWNGEHYDGVQRGIIYNHLAIGPREWGRAGPEVALKLDDASRQAAGALVAFERYDTHSGAAAGFVRQQMELRSMAVRDLAETAGLEEFRLAVIVDGFDPPTDTEARAISQALGLDPALLINQIPDADRRDNRGAPRMETRTIRVDSIDVQVQASHASLIEKAIADRDARIDELSKRADEADGKLDGLTTERDELKTKLDEATDPKQIAKAVASRVDLEKGARKILGPEVKLDGKTDREVKVAVLMKTDEAFDPKDRSDDYVNGRFDHVVAAAPDRNHSRDDTRRAIAGGRKPPTQRQDGVGEGDPNADERIDSAESAKARARRQAAELGSKKLRVSVV